MSRASLANIMAIHHPPVTKDEMIHTTFFLLYFRLSFVSYLCLLSPSLQTVVSRPPDPAVAVAQFAMKSAVSKSNRRWGGDAQLWGDHGIIVVTYTPSPHVVVPLWSCFGYQKEKKKKKKKEFNRIFFFYCMYILYSCMMRETYMVVVATCT
jgi:hypothetical protein